MVLELIPALACDSTGLSPARCYIWRAAYWQACVWSSLSTWTRLLLTFATGVSTQAPWGTKPILSDIIEGRYRPPQLPRKRRKSSLRGLMSAGRALPAMSPSISVKGKLAQKKAFCCSVDHWEMVGFGIIWALGRGHCALSFSISLRAFFSWDPWLQTTVLGRLRVQCKHVSFCVTYMGHRC